MCSPEKPTPSSGGDEVEGKHVRNRAALGVCEARSVAGKVVAGLLAPRAGGDGGGCFDSVPWPPFSHRFPAVPNPTDPVQERRPGAGVGRPCMQCWGCTVGNGKSLHCPQVLEALEPLTPEGPVVKVKSDFKMLVQGLIMFSNELPQACFV